MSSQPESPSKKDSPSKKTENGQLQTPLLETDDNSDSHSKNKDQQQMKGNKEPVSIEMGKAEKQSEYQRANFFSKLFFAWILPLIKKGNKVFLEQDMHEPLPQKEKTYYLFSKLNTEWNKRKLQPKYPLIRALFAAQRGDILFCFLLNFLSSAVDITSPIIIKYVIQYVSSKHKSLEEGFTWLGAVIGLKICQTFLQTHIMFHFSKLGYNLSNSVGICLYKKALSISMLSNKNYKTGDLVNLLSVDAMRLLQLANQISSVLFLPIQLVVGLVIMYESIGVTFLAGFAVMLLMGGFNFILGKLSVKYQKGYMKDKDKRIKITNELFGQIKFVKVNAWEEHFYDRLDRSREEELYWLRKKYEVGVGQVVSTWFTPVLVVNATFALFTLLGNEINPENSFVVISLFQVLQEPISQVPQVITSLVEAGISISRIQKFLLTEEVDLRFIEHLEETQQPALQGVQESHFAIELQDGNFYWGREPDKDKEDASKRQGCWRSICSCCYKKDKKQVKKGNASLTAEEQDRLNSMRQVSAISSIANLSQDRSLESAIDQSLPPNVLKNINISIRKGSLVALIGDVGSGKSSLLYALIGEMRYYDDVANNPPKMRISGSTALVNQKPWITNQTVKDNIVFGLPYDEKKYKECLQYSCLEPDLKVLTNGDSTMIGEKGVNLSGGQKARVALARALYSESDILLLDDILSAVDVHVGIQIVKDCLLGYKRNCTRLLVTHALYYMKYMDYIYFMEQGTILMEGTYNKIAVSPKYQEIAIKFRKGHQDEENLSEIEEGKADEEEDLLDRAKNTEIVLEKAAEVLTRKKSKKDSFKEDEAPKVLTEKDRQKEREKQKEKELQRIKQLGAKDKYDELILEEDRKKGKIEWKVFLSYFVLNGGWCFIIPFFLSILLQNGLRMLSAVWISIWADDSDPDDSDPDDNTYYLIIYSVLSFGYCIFVALRSVILFACSFFTARKVHRGMIVSLIYAPLNEFFERIPLGRILNRLTKDMQTIDTEIAWSFTFVSSATFNALVNICLCVYASSIYVVAPIVLFLIICVFIQQFYQKAQREVVRLENITKSPVVSFFAESLNGLPTIRAYAQSERFFNTHCLNLDENKKNQISQLAMTQWFRQVLSLISLIINISAISFCLFTNSSSPAKTGLLLTYAFQIDFNVRFMLIQFSWFENRLVSLERCQSYMSIDAEKGYNSYLPLRDTFRKQNVSQAMALAQADTLWPREGIVEFHNVHVRYRPNLPPVLKGLDFSVKPCEKIGIVGRTGAGKSTITLCLLRVLELLEGNIIIDGLDIARMSLGELRSKITIILQDPSLYEGTLRENVDPLLEHKDEEILDTLLKCNLKQLLDSRKGLDTEISDSGENLSVGEKQLVCIARALLKKSKLVLIDEATANVDIETEGIIQQTIREVFRDCTVLTIAHRINTILQSDRILVMSDGRKEEFDTPQNLLKNPNSVFYQLHQAAMSEGQM